jgi:serine/threonine protein kinase
MIGSDQQLRILDFGIGSLLAETEGESLVDTMSTASSLASGLDCASPESIMDPTNLNPIGDQYSLGCVLYYCLTGEYPFPEGTAAEKMMAHQFKQPRPIRELNPELPEGLAALVERLMQKSPEARYGTTSEVAEALRPFVKSPPAGLPAALLVEQPRTLAPEPSWPAAPAVAKAPPPPRTDNPPLPRSPATTPAVPTRQSLTRGGKAAATTKSEGPAPTPPVAACSLPTRTPAPTAAPAEAPRARPAAEDPHQQGVAPSWAKPSLEERLGPLGIVICAFVISVLAWLVHASEPRTQRSGVSGAAPWPTAYSAALRARLAEETALSARTRL